ncbi:unnamed protein product [Pleuronectes platessa]|uniref:Uncharacterized protein n=1 Tax=Pleuronectes platessa TaxID=8262 RepID=A0A9N7Y6W1_PLEPL|nr:unnamed protein product [Pleuronectes platessa]
MSQIKVLEIRAVGTRPLHRTRRIVLHREPELICTTWNLSCRERILISDVAEEFSAQLENSSALDIVLLVFLVFLVFLDLIPGFSLFRSEAVSQTGSEHNVSPQEGDNADRKGRAQPTPRWTGS